MKWVKKIILAIIDKYISNEINKVTPSTQPTLDTKSVAEKKKKNYPKISDLMPGKGDDIIPFMLSYQHLMHKKIYVDKCGCIHIRFKNKKDGKWMFFYISLCNTHKLTESARTALAINDLKRSNGNVVYSTLGGIVDG